MVKGPDPELEALREIYRPGQAYVHGQTGGVYYVTNVRRYKAFAGEPNDNGPYIDYVDAPQNSTHEKYTTSLERFQDRFTRAPERDDFAARMFVRRQEDGVSFTFDTPEDAHRINLPRRDALTFAAALIVFGQCGLNELTAALHAMFSVKTSGVQLFEFESNGSFTFHDPARESRLLREACDLIRRFESSGQLDRENRAAAVKFMTDNLDLFLVEKR